MTQTQPDEAAEEFHEARERTYTWQDPSPIFAALGSAPGIELLRSIEAGELPPAPIMATLGLGAFSAEVGRGSR